MKITRILGALLVLCFACGDKKTSKHIKKSAESVSVEKGWNIASTEQWFVNDGLINVESIAYDQGNQTFYVSNGLQYGLGTSGFLSKLSKEGDLIALKWVEDLNRPTGMAIHDSILYVADVNALVAIDTRSGEIIEKYLEPISNSGLNDVAVSENGEVYVSGSFKHAVFKLNQGKLTVWAEDEEKLKWANGLFLNGEQVLVAGLHLSTINTKSKEINVVEVDGNIKDFDGLVSDGRGGYFLTTVENSGLFHIDAQQHIIELNKSTEYYGDITFIPERNQLYVPRGNRKDKAFYISVFWMGEGVNEKKE